MLALLRNSSSYATPSSFFQRVANEFCFESNFNYTSEEKIFEPAPKRKVFESVAESEMTNMCMLVSQDSLMEDWENEDDERWNKFLTEPE